jgi:hypothetical protein
LVNLERRGTQVPGRAVAVKALRNTTELRMDAISPNDLYRLLGTAVAPLLFDVCRADAFRADELIVGAVPRLPAGAPAG